MTLHRHVRHREPQNSCQNKKKLYSLPYLPFIFGPNWLNSGGSNWMAVKWICKVNQNVVPLHNGL